MKLVIAATALLGTLTASCAGPEAAADSAAAGDCSDTALVPGPRTSADGICDDGICKRIEGSLQIRDDIDDADVHCVLEIGGDIDLRDRRQWPAFPRLTRVGGSLLPGQARTFEGLDALREVGGDLIMIGYRGTDLAGLDSLEVVGGNITIESDGFGASLERVELPALRQVGGGLTILRESLLTEVVLPALESIDRILLRNSALQRVAWQPGLTVSELEIVGQGLLAVTGDLSGQPMRRLAVTGVLTMPRVNATTLGALRVHYTGLEDLDFIAGVTQVDDIYIRGNRWLASYAGLASLVTVGSIDLVENGEAGPAASLRLDSLEEVLGDFRTRESGLGRIVDLSDLREIAGTFSVQEPRLEELGPFPSLRVVGDGIEWNAPAAAARWPALILRYDGDLYINALSLTGLEQLEELSAWNVAFTIAEGPLRLDSLRSAADLRFLNSGWTSLHLPALREVENFFVGGGGDLGAIGPLDSVRDFGLMGSAATSLGGLRLPAAAFGAVRLEYNPNLQDLSALSNLRSGRSLVLFHNPTLIDLTTLHGIESIESLLQISWNDDLASADAWALVDAIGVGNIGSVEVAGNGP